MRATLDALSSVLLGSMKVVATHQVWLLNLGASEGNTEDCAKAISASLEKLSAASVASPNGQSTGSGGRGVSEMLAAEPRKPEVTVTEENCLVSARGVRCPQSQPPNPTKTLVGEGGTENRSATQPLHCICDPQTHAEWDLIVAFMDQAQQLIDEWRERDFVGAADGDKLFATKWNKIRKFRPLKPIGKQRRKKCPACVLVGWWCVCEAVTCGHDCCLALLKSAQSIASARGGNSRLSATASRVQSLSLEETNRSGVCPLKGFHEGHFQARMAWMVESDDLAHRGFQSHQIAVCPCTMNNDPLSLLGCEIERGEEP